MSELEMIQRLEEIKSLTIIQIKDILSVKEAAMYMDVSKSYLYKLCQKRQIAHSHSEGGKNIYFRKKDLNEWMLHSKSITQKEIEAKAKRFIN
jgi:excisionase family DNA binding protein